MSDDLLKKARIRTHETLGVSSDQLVDGLLTFQRMVDDIVGKY